MVRPRTISVKELALKLPSGAWRKITWRKVLPRRSRVRVRVAHRDYWLTETRSEEWLLIEWSEPTKYWLSTLPEDISFRRLVDHAKLRWRIERDYLELKQGVGLGDFEGRGWWGFHPHATMSIAVYGVLISERGAFPPQPRSPKFTSRNLPYPKIIDPEAPPLRPQFNPYSAPPAYRRARRKSIPLPMRGENTRTSTSQFMTQ